MYVKFSRPTPFKSPRKAVSTVTRLITAMLVAAIATAGTPAFGTSRIKDIASFEGVRDNMLVGYGLVVGLNGTGDTLRNATFTKQSLEAMLERLGVNTRDSNMRTDNVAAVMVTANLPPFAVSGTRIDITVSALGDAESLQGGTLLVTPLIGADGEVYAVSQGTIAVGGFSAQGDAAVIMKGTTTSGRIANGAIVEREIEFAIGDAESLRIALHNPDFTTAKRVADVINERSGTRVAVPLDPGAIEISLPAGSKGDMVAFLTAIEQLSVEPDNPAKVVIDEHSGIIVIGQDVRVSNVAIAQGNLTIRVTETPQVSQPLPFSEGGETVVVPRSDIEVDEQDERRFGILDGGVTLQELVDGLNALGIGPRDMISILQTLKAAGALQAEIELM